MFVSFCIYYAEIPSSALPRAFGCQYWTEIIHDMGLYISGKAASEYIPQPGDLIFFSAREDKVADHVGIVKSYTFDEESGKNRLSYIEGNNGPAVCETFRYMDAQETVDICGYVSMSQIEKAWMEKKQEENADHAAAAAEHLTISPLLESGGETLWLVSVKAAPVDGCVFFINGRPLLYSERHSAWCDAVWSADMPVIEAFVEAPGNAQAVPSGTDLNQTGQTDINDLQLIYCLISGAELVKTIPVSVLISADINADGVIDNEDVQAMIDQITGTNAA